MNYMEEVASLLGVGMNKNFECNESSCTYCITNNGLMCNGCYGADSLMMILNGSFTIKHGPWKPQLDEEFYVVVCDGTVMHKHWDDCSNHLNYYRLGNCYRTKEEAESNRGKWISFYASDEVLEV